jgi:hypothetical protein
MVLASSAMLRRFSFNAASPIAEVAGELACEPRRLSQPGCDLAVRSA